MKNLILKSALFLGAAAMIAQAQSVKVSVPFGFEATGKAMSAGDYSVTRIESNSPGTFVMRNTRTHDSVILRGTTQTPKEGSEAKLVFRAMEDGYYLTELWDGTSARTLTHPHGKNSILAAPRVAIAAHK